MGRRPIGDKALSNRERQARWRARRRREKRVVVINGIELIKVTGDDLAKFAVDAEDLAKFAVDAEDLAKFAVSAEDLAKLAVSAEDLEKFLWTDPPSLKSDDD